MKSGLIPGVLGGAMLVCVSGASAQDLGFEIDTKVSGASIDAQVSLDASGFLIGDYDAETNPDGTQTRPGFFGGSGNQPIDTTTVLASTTTLSAAPAGGIMVSLDIPGGTGEINALSVDLLNGSDASTGLSLTLGFDTFRTLNPTFLYPGGIPITIPLGDIGTISSATLTQSAPGVIALAPADLPEAFEVTGAIPATLDLVMSVALPGGEPIELPVDGVPVLVPIAGQLELFGSGDASLELGATPDPIEMTVPLDGVDLPAIPLDVPTLGSETAGLLFTLSAESLQLSATVALDLVALGSPAACPADLTGDGVLDFFDVSAFLSAYTAMDARGDFDGNGVFDFFDVSGFLGAFSAGCP